jgi:putative glutamine amidotransferase
MPTIVISACRKLPDYLESVRRAGGDPHVVDAAADDPMAVLKDAAGLVLTGGGDVDPALYREPPHPTFSAAEPGRDAFEIALVNRALELDLPVLAVCRGLQVLNVARGGTLVQDIPSQVAGAVDHSIEAPSFAIAHEIWISKGSRLWTLLSEKLVEGDACQVNSRHHQAVAHAAPGFEVTATAPDGVIEAMEHPEARFCVGVQWHPENFWRTGEFRSLFEGLMEACKELKR